MYPKPGSVWANDGRFIKLRLGPPTRTNADLLQVQLRDRSIIDDQFLAATAAAAAAAAVCMNGLHLDMSQKKSASMFNALIPQEGDPGITKNVQVL
jgi:hypothetical protein